MAKRKSTVFIGSSSEARKIVEEFCRALDSCSAPIPWWDASEFKPGHSALDGLLEACNVYDFGLFVFTPDDKYESRGKEGFSVRDNVLFEYGLFLGKLGQNRTFAVVQAAANPEEQTKIPSDLLGIHLDRFQHTDEKTRTASVNRAARPICVSIEKYGPVPIGGIILDSYGFSPKTATFTMTLKQDKLKSYTKRIGDRKFVVVARKFDEEVNVEDDVQIAIGVPRTLSELSSGNPVYSARGEQVFARIEKGERIDGYLLLIPNGYDVQQAKTLGEMLNNECEIITGRGKTPKP